MTEKSIISLDTRLLNLINPITPIETIAEGFIFTEGPVWNSQKNFLLFSDIPGNKIYKWSVENGIEVYREPSHFSNGLTYNSNGLLIACEHQSRSITQEQKNGRAYTLASHFKGKKLNSPNDLVISRDGSIFFTDPIYGLREGNGGPAEQELAFQGVYHLLPGTNEPELIFNDFERPNGLAFSPDEKTLFVVDTVRQHVRMFSVNDKWQFSGGCVWAELWDDTVIGRPDGLKVDCEGNVFCTGPGGVWIFNRDGDLLGRIFVYEKTSNLAWGEDGHSLFITSSSKIFRVKCKTEGKPPNILIP